MRYDKRIWKTAAIALVITIVAGAFVMRLGDWVKGLNSDFVYAQATVTGGGSGSGGSTGATGSSGSSETVTQTQIIPQVAVGSFDGNITAYQTFIIVANPSATTPVTVSANFYTAAGAASPVIGFLQSTVSLGSSTATTSTFTGGTTNPVTLPAGATVTFQSQVAAGTPGTTGWGKITSTATGTSANVVITAGYTISYVQGGGVLSIVGVAASPANMQTFTIARSRNQSAGLDTGFAIVNTGTTTATLTATLRDLSGATISTQPITLAAGQQVAEFGTGLFYPGKTPEPTFTGTNVFIMTFDASPTCAATGCAQFAATALTFEGAIQASYPVNQLK